LVAPAVPRSPLTRDGTSVRSVALLGDNRPVVRCLPVARVADRADLGETDLQQTSRSPTNQAIPARGGLHSLLGRPDVVTDQRPVTISRQGPPAG